MCIVGSHDTNTLIVERQWESMAAMEKAYETTKANPDFQKPTQRLNNII